MTNRSVPEAAYLIASLLFIFGFKRLSSPRTARSGNLVAAVGMALALRWHVPASGHGAFRLIFVAICHRRRARMAAGQARQDDGHAANGFPLQRHGRGLRAVYFAGGMVQKPVVSVPGGHVNFIGSELLGLLPDAAGCCFRIGQFHRQPGRLRQVAGVDHRKTGALAFAKSHQRSPRSWPSSPPRAWRRNGRPNRFGLSRWLSLRLALGVLQVLPIGGADMPVVISVLNSCTGLAAAVTGFAMHNMSMIIAGTLVGAAGSFLTVLMCNAMNRSLAKVIFGSFGMAPAAGAAAAPGRSNNARNRRLRMRHHDGLCPQGDYHSRLRTGRRAGASIWSHELEELLEKRGIEVKYAIHPVAGRMPGHMNVLLAEADVPYPKLFDMDEINPDFDQADVALIVGANDVVNPAARTDSASPIFGMPILNADKAKNVIVIKRGRGAGFAGIENRLFFDPKTRMLFGDAKKALQELVTEVKAL